MPPAQLTIADDGWDRQHDLRELQGRVLPDYGGFRQPVARDPDDLLLTATTDRRLAGFLWASQAEGIGYLRLLCVAPQFQRQGAGRALIRDAAIRLAGCRQLSLLPIEGPTEDALVAYYERQGFIDPPRDPGTPRMAPMVAAPADVIDATSPD